MRYHLRAAGLLLITALALTACGTPASTSARPQAGAPAADQSSAVINTRHTSIGTVLTTARGKTIYWFAADTARASRCTGGCASLWPRVRGPVAAALGLKLPGKFGTITDASGLVQATYDGHPLYTYILDREPGQTAGNMYYEDGSVWWAMTPSAIRPGAPAASGPSHSAPARQAPPAPSSSSTPGGYGY